MVVDSNPAPELTDVMSTAVTSGRLLVSVRILSESVAK